MPFKRARQAGLTIFDNWSGVGVATDNIVATLKSWSRRAKYVCVGTAIGAGVWSQSVLMV
jgi:hypothetical protein